MNLDGFRKIEKATLDALMRCPVLSPDFRLYCYALLSEFNPGGEIIMSAWKAAAETGLTYPTAKRAVVNLTKAGAIRIVRTIGRSTRLCTLSPPAQICTGANTNRLKSEPVPAQKQTVTGSNLRRIEEQKNMKTVETPAELRGLDLYSADRNLLSRWPDLMASWRSAYPGVDLLAEIRKAHAWEVSNPKRRKKDKAKYLNGWLSRAKPAPDREDDEPRADPEFYASLAELKP